MTQLPPELPLSLPSKAPPAYQLSSLEPNARSLEPRPPVAVVECPQPHTSSPRRSPLLAKPVVAGLLALGASLLTIGLGRDQSSQDQVVGRAEMDTTPSGAHQRWQRRDVTVVVDASVKRIGPQAESAIQNAFGAWLVSGSDLPKLTFDTAQGIEPSLQPDGINAVIYAPITFEGHQDDLAITIGFSDDRTGEITEADIIINTRQPFSALPEPARAARASSCDGSMEAKACDHRYDLQNVLTHEVGHFYGLGEDRENRSATMFSCTSPCETHKRELDVDDIAVVTALYQSGYEETYASATGCGGASIANSSTPFGWVGCLGVGVFGGLLWRRRRSVAGQNQRR